MPSHSKASQKMKFEDLLFEEDHHSWQNFENLIALTKKLCQDSIGKKIRKIVNESAVYNELFN